MFAFADGIDGAVNLHVAFMNVAFHGALSAVSNVGLRDAVIALHGRDLERQIPELQKVVEWIAKAEDPPTNFPNGKRKLAVIANLEGEMR